MQLKLFENQPYIKKLENVERSSKPNGSKDAISRYSGLKDSLDKDRFYNGNWYEVDTTKVDEKKVHINFIDLFTGAGGMAIGVKSAGFSKVASVEIDKDASNTIRKNFPESIHFDGKEEGGEGGDHAVHSKELDFGFFHIHAHHLRHIRVVANEHNGLAKRMPVEQEPEEDGQSQRP